MATVGGKNALLTGSALQTSAATGYRDKQKEMNGESDDTQPIGQTTEWQKHMHINIE